MPDMLGNPYTSIEGYVTYCIPGCMYHATYHVVSVVGAQKDGVPGAAGPDYTERPDRNRPVSYCESKSSCARTECCRDRFSYRWDR